MFIDKKSLLAEDKSNNESIKAQSFGKNQNEDHSNKNSVLLSIGSHTSITNKTNGQTSSQGRQTTAQTSCQMGISLEEVIVSLRNYYY